MISDNTPGPVDDLEEEMENLRSRMDRIVPVVNVKIPMQAAPVVNVAAAKVIVPDPKPCVPVAYDLVIVARDKEGRIKQATLTPIK